MAPNSVTNDKGAINEGWTVMSVRKDHEHYQDKHLHKITLSRGTETFHALEVSASSHSKMEERLNCPVNFVILSPGSGNKLSWIKLDDIMPVKYDFKDAAYMARDAVKATVELITTGHIKYESMASVENNAREIMAIMVKLAKENGNDG